MTPTTPEQLAAQKEERDRNCVTLDATHVNSGRELGLAAVRAHGSISHAAAELSDEAASLFASLVDSVRDYTDLADDLRETEKLDIYRELEQLLTALSAADVSVCYSVRRMRIGEAPMAILYLVAFEKGSEPKQFVALRRVEFG